MGCLRKQDNLVPRVFLDLSKRRPLGIRLATEGKPEMGEEVKCEGKVGELWDPREGGVKGWEGANKQFNRTA